MVKILVTIIVETYDILKVCSPCLLVLIPPGDLTPTYTILRVHLVLILFKYLANFPRCPSDVGTPFDPENGHTTSA